MMKNNFFLLFLIYRYIFSGHYLLSYYRYGYGAGDKNILTVKMMSYDQIFDLFELFIKELIILSSSSDASFVPIWIMMLSGFFLNLKLSETLDLLFLPKEKIVLLSSCYLRVSLPSNLLSLNLLLLTWYRCSSPRRYVCALILAGE